MLTNQITLQSSALCYGINLYLAGLVQKRKGYRLTATA